MTLQGQIKPISLQGSINVVPNEGGTGGPLQSKTVYPSHEEQIITPDEDFYGLSLVKIKPVPRIPAVEASVSTDIYIGPNLVEKVINHSVGVETTQPSCVSYYYNRELLPETPPEVAGCPYLVIVRSLTASRLYASFNKPYVYTRSDGTVRLQIPAGGYVRCQYNSSHNVWFADQCDDASIYLNLHGAGGWVVWWSNFDIPDGSASAEEFFWHASEPTVDKPNDATHYYYNGVRLPEIPKTIQENYTGYWIYRHETSKYYRLLGSNSTWYIGGDPVGVRDTASSDDVRFNITDDEVAAGANWSEMAAGNYYYTYTEGVQYPLWTVQDIRKDSATSTTISVYATLAVPDPTE